MAHPYASQVKASQKRRMASLHAKTGKAHGSVNVDLKNSYKNAGTQREYTISGSSAKPRADRYAKGGKVKKGNVTNVIIAQPKGDAAPPPPRPIPVPVPVRPPMGAAPPPGVPAGAPPAGLPVGGPPVGPPQGLPLGARPPGLKKGGSVSPSPILPNKEIYHQEGRGYADGGFLRETPGETYRGFPHSPTTSVDDAISAHKKGGSVKKRAFGGMGGLPAPQQGGGIPLPMPPQMAKQRAAKMAAMKAKAGQKPQAGLGAGMGGMGGASPPMYKDGGSKKASGGPVGGAGSGLGRLRESAIAAKVPAKTES